MEFTESGWLLESMDYGFNELKREKRGKAITFPSIFLLKSWLIFLALHVLIMHAITTNYAFENEVFLSFAKVVGML